MIKNDVEEFCETINNEMFNLIKNTDSKNPHCNNFGLILQDQIEKTCKDFEKAGLFPVKIKHEI